LTIINHLVTALNGGSRAKAPAIVTQSG